jgi:hypothetical protein
MYFVPLLFTIYDTHEENYVEHGRCPYRNFSF